jgi:hypothetical protein
VAISVMEATAESGPEFGRLKPICMILSEWLG